eukprot:TRINITY_DN68274_c0_g1_i1.p1 TRINITY_DN68274_c0_g1~~TRINITY_DN68274_c0_g1_i1.p1  ORF type:complete len:115 (+),score=26.32 TRINITY_DN68274_c0_g1_i1:52-396(+)
MARSPVLSVAVAVALALFAAGAVQSFVGGPFPALQGSRSPQVSEDGQRDLNVAMLFFGGEPVTTTTTTTQPPLYSLIGTIDPSGYVILMTIFFAASLLANNYGLFGRPGLGKFF